MSVRMRHTRSHTRNRRSHHALPEPRLGVCVDCSGTHVRHTTCPHCGRYRGRVIIDTVAKALSKEKRKKARLENVKKTGEEEKAQEEVKPLNAEKLSR